MRAGVAPPARADAVDGRRRTGSRAIAGPIGAVPSFAPVAVGIVVAVLLVFVSFGITEPFMTIGYADPIWSLAAVGAIAYGLQIQDTWSNRGVAVVLLLVAGMSKDEGLAVAFGLVVLIAVRSVVTMAAGDRRRHWPRPVLVGVAELAALGAWPVVLRLIHARGCGPPGPLPGRSTGSRGPTPRSRGWRPISTSWCWPSRSPSSGACSCRGSGGGSESATTCGRGSAWSGARSPSWRGFVTATGNIPVWLLTTADRVTEFPALMAWWIIALWAVVASAAPAAVVATDAEDDTSVRDAGRDAGRDTAPASAPAATPAGRRADRAAPAAPDPRPGRMIDAATGEPPGAASDG